MSDKKLLNRRQFLERAALLGAAALGAGTLLSACDPPEPTVDDEDEAPANDEFSCNDEQALADLTDDEIARREELEYTDDTPNPQERCDNCVHWQEPGAGENCGGCAILAGPFHPAGWCNQWVAMPS
jgi:hypothetical protein